MIQYLDSFDEMIRCTQRSPMYGMNLILSQGDALIQYVISIINSCELCYTLDGTLRSLLLVQAPDSMSKNSVASMPLALPASK